MKGKEWHSMIPVSGLGLSCRCSIGACLSPVFSGSSCLVIIIWQRQEIFHLNFKIKPV